MLKNSFILKGNIAYSQNKDTMKYFENSYLICVEGKSEGIFSAIPEQYQGLPVTDYGDAMILPGLIDLHIHAPQYIYRSLGMDLELLDWLDQIAFPQEAKYKDLDYARKAYSIFASDAKASATTRHVMFGTQHKDATIALMDEIEKTGIKAFVGKVNMDRNAPDILREESAEVSAEQTIQWIQETKHRYHNVKPILTPRFIPSCTDELMHKLAQIQKEYELPLQSHLSENLCEIAWVSELCPDSENYGDAYYKRNLFGGQHKAVMAHCVYSDKKEIALMKQQGVFVAHCPQSNLNLASGIAPVRTYLEEGLFVGLGSDVAGGYSNSIFRAMADCIQMSKIRWRLIDQELKPLTFPEAFYLGTKGGGAFFGKVGSLEAEYEFDAIVIDDSALKTTLSLSLPDRLERMIYLSDDRHIISKYVAGEQIF